MNTKHTLGPWSFDDYLNIVDIDGQIIKAQGISLSSGDIARANARLIVAAPDLLKELREVEVHLRQFIEITGINEGRSQTLLESVRAAIAKATGETL